MRRFLLPLLFVLTSSVSYAQIALPITFDALIDYELRTFGGAEIQLVDDPTDSDNTVAEFVRTANALSFAGAVVADSSGFAEPIPFEENATTMSVRVWTPEAGTPVRLKVENAENAAVSVETQVRSTKAGEWEILVFDFSRQAAGTQEIDLSATYNKAAIFFDFGTENDPNAVTYYWEDLAFGGEAAAPISLPVTFDMDIDYELNAFEGAESRLVADPEDPDNTVAEFVRTAGAGVPAGVTVADQSGFDQPIPFTAGMTTMSVRVWTPMAGTPVRLKVEKAGDPTVSVETQTVSTRSREWETLTFDFADEAMGTAALNLNSEYTKASIFFDFGREGAATATTYYWENLAFGAMATSVEDVLTESGARLLQNAPNPFRTSTMIQFSTPYSEHVEINVYNVLGQRIATLIDGPLPGGDHSVTMDASGLASGVYIYRLRVGSESVTRSMVVAR